MQIESNQSKLPLGLLPLCVHCEFKTNILFLIFLFVEPVPLSHHLWAPLVVYLMLNSRCFAFLGQHVAADKQFACLQKEKFNFPLSGLTDLLEEKDG